MRNRGFALGLVAASIAATPFLARAGGAGGTFVFNGEGNRLNVYDTADPLHPLTLIHSAADGDQGDGKLVRDLNAQICFQEHDGDTYFIGGEDTGQGDQGGGGEDDGLAGWGWFRLSGDSLATFDAEQRGKLVPEYQASFNENYGCSFLDDGRLLLSDVGEQQPYQASNGQLHIWFPDAVEGFGAGYDPDADGFKATSDVPYCMVDRQIATAGSIWADGPDSVLVASARPGLNTEGWGIFRFSNLPDSPAECTDADGPGGAPATATGVTKELFIFDPVNVPTPNAVVGTPGGTYIVSSVFNGVIAEYSADGIFLRRLLAPELTDGPLPPFTYGTTSEMPQHSPTPLGIGLTSDGQLWFADIGIVASPTGLDNIGPGDGTGTVRYLDLSEDDGNPLTPLAPHLVDEGLAFPDGIGVLELAAG